ncbi:MAG: hypothetical protein D4R80_00975 [Deltaproteobacteria bacterium]|nr:MAG: hypothetical protein D4R80_00975 [Deltaproteobacteria bacterium]
MMEKLTHGWKCTRCQHIAYGLTEAITHITHTHGGEHAMDPEGNLYNVKESGPAPFQKAGVL